MLLGGSFVNLNSGVRVNLIFIDFVTIFIVSISPSDKYSLHYKSFAKNSDNLIPYKASALKRCSARSLTILRTPQFHAVLRMEIW